MFNISSILIGVLVLLNSFGFTVSTHFCGGEKVKSAIGMTKIDFSCGMKKEKENCPQKNELHSSCCVNVFDYHNLDETVKKDVVKLKKITLSPPVLPIIKASFTTKQVCNINQNFSPPLLVKDHTITLCSFLI